jgi:hypothetical protein
MQSLLCIYEQLVIYDMIEKLIQSEKSTLRAPYMQRT